MIKRNSINIPAVLVHTIGNTEYRVNGQIVDINESNQTVSMKFKGYKNIEHGIPMENILVNENILDTLKDAGRKTLNAVKNLVRKVRGFLYVVINGRPAVDSINAPVNLAISAANGKLAGCKFYPSASMIALAEENGVTLPNDEPDIDITDSERDQIEGYWSKVMKQYVSDEDATLEESVKYVKQHFYKDRLKNKLNEAFTLSLDNPSGFEDIYGDQQTLKQIKRELRTNVLAQLKRNIGDPLGKFGPLIIWGAPGIGKTACIKLLASDIRETLGLDLAIETVQCSGLSAEDWGLPATRERVQTERDKNNEYKFDTAFATSVAQAWLPVYRLTDDPAYNAAIDNYFNSGAAKPGNQGVHDGGIIFFDELTRLPRNAKNMMMALVDQGNYQDMVLASHWAIVCAANRYEDVLGAADADEADFVWETAQDRRFNHITFRPSKNEWLKWARGINKETGIQNIHEKFCKFIEISDENVWYATLDNGGFDTYLTDEERKQIQDYKSNTNKTITKDSRDEIRSLMKDKMGGSSHLTVTPGDWEKVSTKIDEFLANDLFIGHPELIRMCYKNGTLDNEGLSKALNSLSPSEWEDFYETWAEDSKLDPTGRMANNRLGFVNEYITQIIMRGKFGQDSVAMRQWKVYNNYQQTFTPDVIESIWNTGKMPAGPLRQDDDKYIEMTGEYKTTEYSKWKSDTKLATQVIELILENVPGGMNELANIIINDNKAMESAPEVTDDEFNKLFDKYLKMYTFKLGKTDIYTFVNPADRNATG